MLIYAWWFEVSQQKKIKPILSISRRAPRNRGTSNDYYSSFFSSSLTLKDLIPEGSVKYFLTPVNLLSDLSLAYEVKKTETAVASISSDGTE